MANAPTEKTNRRFREDDLPVLPYDGCSVPIVNALPAEELDCPEDRLYDDPLVEPDGEGRGNSNDGNGDVERPDRSELVEAGIEFAEEYSDVLERMAREE